MRAVSRSLVVCALMLLPAGAGGQTGESDGPTAVTSDGASASERGPAAAEPGGDKSLQTELGEAKSPPDAAIDADGATESGGEGSQGASSAGESPPTESANLSDVLQEVTTRLAELERKLEPSTTEVTPPDVAELKQNVADLTRVVSQLTQVIKDNQQGLAQLDVQVAGQRELAEDNAARLKDLAASGGGSPSVLGNMQSSPAVRDELYENTRYRLRIRNTTGSEQPLYVNGVLWNVRNEEWTFAPIPKGPVNVQQPNHTPVEIAESEIQWKADRRGYYVEYDLESNTVLAPPPAYP